MVSFKKLGVLVGLILEHCCRARAHPSPDIASLSPDIGDSLSQYTPNYDDGLHPRADAQDFYLRIMPLGASITKGDFPPEDDPHHNGYRKALRDKLRFEGWEVNMVGNFNNWGDMADRDHEGKSGDRVSQVKTRAEKSLRTWLPNVVLINAGTNDATQDGEVEDVGGTGARMKQLVDVVYSIVPDTVIVLSTLIPNPDYQHNIDTINEQYRSLYRGYVPLDEEGKEKPDPKFKMVLAEMADGFITDDDILPDVHPTHPTTEGDRKMAAVWDWAIAKANDNGWLKKPTDSAIFKDGDEDKYCKKPYASGGGDPRGAPQVLKATNPVIVEDSKFKSNNKERTDRRGQWRTPDSDSTRLWFAQLYNEFGSHKLRERDELIIAYETGGDIMMQVNHGDGNFGDSQKIEIPISCKTKGIHWGDVNGDVLDDFICIAEDGEMLVAINQGGNPPTFKDIGSYKNPEKGLGQENVRLGDMDGDGRLDYCVLEGHGDLYCWRNGGVGEHAEYWQDMGSGHPIFHGKGMGDIAGVRLVDINGDGRSDWLWLDDRGRTTTWINNRGSGQGMIPRWAEIGQTHDMDIDRSIVDDRRAVQFGRIFGDNGVADYVHWWRVDCKDKPICKFTWKGWQQLGGGSRYQKGDGINFGDMTGKGVDDYVWIRPWSKDGEVEIFINKNSKDKNDDYATQPWSAPVRVNTNIDWRGLHIGDWDGDGKQDIIGITNRDTGSLKVWLSRWDGHSFNWDVQEISDSDKCGEGWGTLYRDHGAHFADITNSGRVDYLCMRPDGKTTAWLRDEQGGWFDAGQVKRSEGKDRANLQFADADGDGRADLIWTDKFTGDAKVWYNLQQGKESDREKWHGSLFEWAPPSGPSYQGPTRGPNEYFPNLGGVGRADILGADPWTGKGTVWFNSCPSGGDDGPISDPKLPAYSPSKDPPGGGDPPPPSGDWFCGVAGTAWDSDMWNKHNVGPWLKNRVALYSGVDETWPKSPDDNYFQFSGIPRVLAGWDGPNNGDPANNDNAYNWAGVCRQVDEQCTMEDTSFRFDKHCAEGPERAFSLWAMHNYALFFQNWWGKIHDSSFRSSLMNTDIAGTFMQYDGPTDTTAWLTIAIGGISTAAGFMGAAAPIASIAGGILSTANGALSRMGQPTEDPKFTEFGDLQANIGNILNATTNAISATMDHMLNKTPPDHDVEAGTELANILMKGAFANQDFFANATIDEGTVTNLITAGLITEAWLSGSVGIIKWSNDSYLAQEWGFNPCFGGGYHDLERAVACQFGKNYMIGRLLSDDLSDDQVNQLDLDNFPDIGQNEKTLAKYALDHRIVIQSAERIQSQRNKYKPRGIENLEPVLQDLINNPVSEKTLMFENLVSMNIPVCDLDILGDLDIQDHANVPSNYCLDGASKVNRVADCLLWIFNDNCKNLPKLGDTEWPYHTDRRWEG